MSMPMAIVPRQTQPKLRLVLGACAALLARLALRLLRFHRVVAIVRWIQGRTQHAAAPADVLLALAAIDVAGAWLPCRVACLERSLAAVLLLAGRRRGVAWQVGVRMPPLAMHAWLTSTDGEILGEPESTAAYEPLLVVKPPHDT